MDFVQLFYFEKIRVFHAGIFARILQHGIIEKGISENLFIHFAIVMTNRDSWGRLYWIARGEIL